MEIHGHLFILLILIIIFILNIKIKQNDISSDCDNYLDLIQFVRIFQQFSIEFLTVVCIFISEEEGCKTYISKFDTDEFNQTEFNIEQSKILAELGSESINKLIQNTESIKDEVLFNLLKGNFTYNLISKKKMNNIYNITNSLINISLKSRIMLSKKFKRKKLTMKYDFGEIKEPTQKPLVFRDTIKNFSQFGKRDIKILGF